MQIWAVFADRIVTIASPSPQGIRNGVRYTQTVTATSDADQIDLARLRERLRQMNDTTLLRWGQSAAYMASPASTWGDPPWECFAIQLREARTEWRRRHAGH